MVAGASGWRCYVVMMDECSSLSIAYAARLVLAMM